MISETRPTFCIETQTLAPYYELWLRELPKVVVWDQIKLYTLDKQKLLEYELIEARYAVMCRHRQD